MRRSSAFFNSASLPGSCSRAFRSLAATVLSAGLGVGLNIGLDASPALAQAAATGAEWVTAGGTPQGARYSSLSEIDNFNAGSLVEEFSYPTGTKASHQGSPLVVGSTMYVVTPFPNKLIALDLAHPGAALWTFNPNPGAYARGLTCCDVVNRGAAYADGLVVYTLLDGNVVAVDAKTGKQVWRKKVADPWLGETLNTAPIIVRDKVIFGSSGSEMGIRGSVRALNLKTGALVWQAYSTGPDADVKIDATFKPYYAKDKGKDLGATTWPSGMWANGGASSWTWITYDPDTNQIFYGTSQPGTFNPDLRPGDNKWAATIFARNPDTGKANWAYQTVPHDNWDYDATSENTVVDLPIGGKLRKVIVNFHKNGLNYIIDRVSGEVISAKPFSFLNWAKDFDKSTGLPVIDPSKLTHEGAVTSNICPSAFGAKDWEWSSFSDRTKYFYFGGFNMCMSYEPFKVSFIAGTPIVGASIGMAPGAGGNMGEFVAFEPVTGTRVWTIKEPLPVFGGALSTAGNVVFYGTLDKQFKAVDATNGKVLFAKTLECGVASAPIAFKGADGKQRVAITTGLGFINGGFAGGPCPGGATFSDNEGASTESTNTRAAAVLSVAKPAATTATTVTSGYVHVFKLP